MAVICGTNGKVAYGPTPTDIAQVRTWSLTHSVESKVYASSATAGTRRRACGIEDATGEFTYYQDDVSAISSQLTVGAAVELTLYEDTGREWNLSSAFIDAIEINVDVENGEIVGGTVRFSNNGTITPVT